LTAIFPYNAAVPEENSPPQLVRGLSLWDSTLLVVGLVIGSAIFLTTGQIAERLPSPALILGVWIVGGVLSLCGSLLWAELGAAQPEAGGQYHFLKLAYGDAIGFLYGWTLFIVIQTGMIAALAVGYAEYAAYFFPSLGLQQPWVSLPLPWMTLSISAGQANAVASILIFSLLNYLGLRSGTGAQNLFTVLKLAAILGLVAAGLLWGKGSWSHFAAPAAAAAAASSAGSLGLGAYMVSLVAVLWAFDGWNNITFAAGEMRDPQRNIPRSLLWGLGLITLSYAALNVLYLYALPVERISGVSRIGEAALTASLGPRAAWLLSAAVIVSILGCTSASILAGPRVYYAMARDGLFFPSVARVHPRFQVPTTSIVFQAVWSSLLVVVPNVTGDDLYEALYTFATVANLIFYFATAGAVMVLRRRPGRVLPYRTPGYPWTAWLFMAGMALVLLSTFRDSPWASLYGVGLILLGLPFYFAWKRRARRSA
jgi:APA family basic amino acid/polyamine antiporter